MKRLPDWDLRLTQFIDANRNTPFEWGRWDCVMFASSAIETMTGIRVGENYAFKYNSPLTAARILKTSGFGSLADAVLKETGGKIHPIPAMGRGDIVVLPESNEHPVGACGVCIGSWTAFPVLHGLVFRESREFPEGTKVVRF